MGETIPIRTGEGIDHQAVKQFITARFEDIPSGDLLIKQFPVGSSNLTYLLQCEDWRMVLRRPPFGELPPKAHDVEREYRLLSQLYHAFPLIPKTYTLCTDKEVIGAPFYLMEFKEGVTMNKDISSKLTVKERKSISYLMVDAIVALHTADYKNSSLESFGYPHGFLERQVKNWVNRYETYKTKENRVINQLIHWLLNHIPESQGTAIIHNDFKLNNVLLSKDFSRIEAILDWEMATVGDPLFDLGATLSYWIEEKDPELLKNSLESSTAFPGYISRRDFLEAYAQKTGSDVSSFLYYLKLTYFKTAVAKLQIYHRFITGKTKDHRFAAYNEDAIHLMLHAEQLTQSKDF